MKELIKDFHYLMKVSTDSESMGLFSDCQLHITGD